MAGESSGPRVGVAVIVLSEAGLVLLGKRRGAHGAGTWGLPGGHLELGESVEACARREVREETGLEVGALRPGPYGNDVIEGRHYVTLFVVGRAAAGEVSLREPAKCEAWAWFPWTGLPSPLFLPLASLRATGYAPSAPDDRGLDP